MVENVCTRAYMQFDFSNLYIHFPHMTDLKWLFSNVKLNSESIAKLAILFSKYIGSVVFSLTMYLELFFYDR